MSKVLDLQLTVKHSTEEVLAWSRIIHFEWVAPNEDVAQPVMIKLYHSDFDGFDVDWEQSLYPQSFRDLVGISENELGEVLDGLTWNFTNE